MVKILTGAKPVILIRGLGLGSVFCLKVCASPLAASTMLLVTFFQMAVPNFKLISRNLASSKKPEFTLDILRTEKPHLLFL